ncbi:MAG: nucleotidyl transferase AbiEii/AbiGii toxin family protein [Flavobacteriaceae bacterium]
MQQWKKDVDTFLELADRHEIKMLMVGGAAVNFHGYQRHSADVDFWLDTSQENLDKLGKVFQEMGFDFRGFPKEVGEQKQNISLKFSPADLDVELITKFNVGKTFNEAYQSSEEAHIGKIKVARYRVLSFEDLITSKVKSARAKDLLDVQELKRIKPRNRKRGRGLGY